MLSLNTRLAVGCWIGDWTGSNAGDGAEISDGVKPKPGGRVTADDSEIDDTGLPGAEGGSDGGGDESSGSCGSDGGTSISRSDEYPAELMT